LKANPLVVGKRVMQSNWFQSAAAAQVTHDNLKTFCISGGSFNQVPELGVLSCR
jgi:hypothetical protein